MRRCSVAKRRALALLLCLLLLLCTACGGQAQEDAGALHCTVRIECSTVLAHMDDLKAGKADIVPSDGVLLPETTVAFSEGGTVFDVLQQVCRAQGIHMESTWTPAYNSAYIEGIGNLYEFDCGELSGWMYSVNGVWPDYGCSGYTLHDGDTVVWSYTCLPEAGGTLATSTGSVLVRLRFQLADGVAEAALTVSDAVLAAADETESLATTTAALTVVNATVQRG